MTTLAPPKASTKRLNTKYNKKEFIKYKKIVTLWIFLTYTASQLFNILRDSI